VNTMGDALHQLCQPRLARVLEDPGQQHLLRVVNPDRYTLQQSRKLPAFLTFPSSRPAKESAVVFPLMVATSPTSKHILVQFMVSSTSLAGWRIVEHMEASANPAIVWSCSLGVELLAFPLSVYMG
jgi:hypothetical protein